MKKFDAFMMKFIKEHPRTWRRGVSGLYVAMIAWHLWNVVRQDAWWGVNLLIACCLAGIWGLMAFTWGRHDRCGEIERLVAQELGLGETRSIVWLWAYKTSRRQQSEIITWMGTHSLTRVPPDDMPPAVRGLANFLVAFRS